jgi:hypothetical protein
MGKRYSGRRWVYSYCEMQNLLLDRKQRQDCDCMWDILTKHVGHMIVIWDLPRFAMKKRWDLHCKRLWPLEKHNIVCPKGAQVNFDPSQ